jgi:signal transduction histidine kinase
VSATGSDHPAPETNTAAGRPGGTIRRRIIRTLALPVAVVLVLLAIVTVIEVDDYRAADATARAVTLDLAVQDLVQELQTERGLTAGLLGGNVGFRGEFAPARKRVDAARAAIEKLTAAGGNLEDRVGAAVHQLDGLAGVRAGTDTGAVGRAPTFAFYTGRIADLSHVDFGLDRSTDASLRRGAATLEALSDVKEATAQERAFLNGVFSASGFRAGEFLPFVTMRSAKDAALASFNRYATTTAQKAMNYVQDTGAAREAAYFEQVALDAGSGRYLQVNPQSWWSALTTVLDDMLRLQRHVGSVIQARAATLQDQATARMSVLLGAVILCFVGSLYLAVVASRSIAAPLSTLADEANRLASTQLPEAVSRATAGDEEARQPTVRVADRASDEVRRVADALDRVQATAYALATEQARLRRSTTESLANLGRRNQNLLRRQLGFITRLEREESDPTGLANLFELDHLATRMRRNAESLLVLVGSASPRQWAEPLPLTDVIRAAVSEVEEYRRVTLRRVDEAMVIGTVVSGIAHMLAELVENGLAFSPPDSDVEIQGRLIGDSYLIAITDQGIGMAAADIESANQRLRGEGDFISAPARFLGHYVVGRLAVEMGINVQLTPSPVTGVTARIVLPPGLLAGSAAVTTGSWQASEVESRPADPSTGAEHTDPAETLVLTLPVAPVPPSAAATPDGRLRPTAVEYVTVPGTAPLAVAAGVGPTAGASYGGVAAPSAANMDLYSFASAAGDDTERTPNGLRKRGRRSGRTSDAGLATASTRASDRPAPVSDSPEAVRARLNAFRNGARRAAEPADPS